MNEKMFINREQPLWELLSLKKDFTIEDVNTSFCKMQNKSEFVVFAWKVLKDPYYSEVYRQNPTLAALNEAGFIKATLPCPSLADFYDKTRTEHLICTPVGKVLDNLEHNTGKTPVVLLSTGGFYPLHDGHIHMMEVARSTLVANGYDVVGGYFSISHNSYVSKKPFNKSRIGPYERIAQCHKQVEDSNWLMVDPWESIYNSTYINFTNVLCRLEWYMQTYVDKRIRVAYVCGGDNAGFMHCFQKHGIGVCVNRIGWSNSFEKMRMETNSENIYYVDENTPKFDFCSRDIRKKQNEIAPQKSDDAAGEYIIRDEGILPLLQFQNVVSIDMLKKAQKEFRDAFLHLLENVMPDTVHMRLIDLQDEIAEANTNLSDMKTISLDSYYNGTHQLEVSRLFDVCDGQIKCRKIVSRLGTCSLCEQIKDILPGKYVLVDDDSITGKTLKAVSDMMPPSIEITGNYLLTNFTGKKIFDAIDLRDFIIGASNAGLVVLMPNGKICRVPYVMPFVSLDSRANIPVELQGKFSHEIWKLNASFYETIDPYGKIAIQNMNPNTKEILLQFAGFHESNTMREVCRCFLKSFK